jgi:hypothetical protein
MLSSTCVTLPLESIPNQNQSGGLPLLELLPVLPENGLHFLVHILAETWVWLIAKLLVEYLQQDEEWLHQEHLREITHSRPSLLEEAMAEELPGPAEELGGERGLPGEREPEARGEGAAGSPAGGEEEPRERPRAAVGRDVGGGVGEGEGERRVERERGRGGEEVEDEEAGEEDGPREERVRRGVHRVPVLRPEEGELRLQVQHPSPPPPRRRLRRRRRRHGRGRGRPPGIEDPRETLRSGAKLE